MKQVLEELCGLLYEQKSVQEELLRLSTDKRQIIKSGDTESLNATVSRELGELSKLRNIERRRTALLPTISDELGIAPQDVTVSTVIEHADEDRKDELRALQRELLSLLNMQAEINAINQDMLKAQLEYTDAMLEVMVGSEDPLNNFYGDDGKASADKKRATGFLDAQI